MPRKKAITGTRTELLTRREAAAFLGVSEQTLAIWACTKRYNLPVVKVGRLSKYRSSDLEQFVNGEPKSEVHAAKPGKKTVGFAEVRVVEEQTLLVQEPAVVAMPLEISLPGGAKLRVEVGCPIQLLASVVHMLENR
ncbi:hypothetical protein BH10CYA1_BH10CYA1_61930 [soil metagenome]